MNELNVLAEAFSTPSIQVKYQDNLLSFTHNNHIYSVNIKDAKFVPILKNVDSYALCNHIHSAPSGSDLVDILQRIIDRIPNIYHYCVTCGVKLQFQSDEYITCGDQECDYRFEEVNIGDIIVERVTDNPNSVVLHLTIAFHAISSNRKYDVFEPFPTKFLAHGNKLKRGVPSALTGYNMQAVKNFDKIDKVCNQWKWDVQKLVDLLRTSKTDQEVYHLVGEDTYHLVRFILTTCKADFTQCNTSEMFVHNNNNNKINNTQIYEVRHHFDREREFQKLVKKNGSNMFFHGSKWANWYSIIRNGLKNCSNTKLQLHGAGQGTGIYFTELFGLSFGHCDHNKGQSVIGVFEVADDKEKYHKGNQIYVFPNETNVLQRYLIIVPSTMNPHSWGPTTDHTLCSIEKYFIQSHQTIEENMRMTITKKCIKRITREYKRVMNIKSEEVGFHVNVDPDENDITIWQINIWNHESNERLFNEMAAFGIDTIKLEIRYGGNYTFEPPFVRIVSPMFKSLTGHITEGGAVCMELLTMKKWSSVYSMESLLVNIVSEIIAGDGQIDEEKIGHEYSHDHAEKTFVRMAKGHGWI